VRVYTLILFSVTYLFVFLCTLFCSLCLFFFSLGVFLYSSFLLISTMAPPLTDFVNIFKRLTFINKPDIIRVAVRPESYALFWRGCENKNEFNSVGLNLDHGVQSIPPFHRDWLKTAKTVIFVHCSLVDILEISKIADPRAQLLVNFSTSIFHLLNPLIQSVKQTPIRNQVLVLNPDFLFDPQMVIKRERITPPPTSSTITPPQEKTSVITECQTTLTGATADELNKDIDRLKDEIEELQSRQ